MIRQLNLAGPVFFALLLYRPAQACTNILTDQITGRDLTAAAPQLGFIPPDLKLGYAPAPGVERIFLPSEVHRTAARYGIIATIEQPVCFAWSLHLLSKQEITSAIEDSLARRDAKVEILEQSRSLAPDGTLVLPIQGFSSGVSAAFIWNGYVTYANGRKFNTWVKVRVTVHEREIIAIRSIGFGEPIDSSAVTAVEYRGPLRRSQTLRNASDINGRNACWPIASGAVLAEQMLCRPRDVTRDQLVTVHVQFGGARVETQGIAKDAGQVGDVIRVRNPKSGRIFRAKIDGLSTVTVVTGGDISLVIEGKKS